MSINHAQTAAAEALSFEAALDALFDKILEQFRQSDLFSSSSQPVVFPVYAHENPVAGTSHAWCVIQIIKWLEAAGCRAISDRTPLFPHHAHEDDSAAIRNILSNQFCLLPRHLGQRQTANERTRADKVLVFCSEVLRLYCINASAIEYAEAIEDVYKECWGQSRYHLEHELQLAVEEKARNGSVWFHHVLTEIAFLKVRKDIDHRDHGIIAVALDDELPDYLPFVGPTDLVLKRENIPLHASDLHKTFFKIILQIYPDQHLAIARFKDCYMTLKSRWASIGGTVVRDSFDATVMKHIRQAYKSILQQDQIATRHRLRGEDIDRLVEHTQDGSDSDILAKDIADRKRKFLSTLSTVPYRERKDRNPERDKGTCIWFNEHSKFQEWYENKGPSLLWVSADPGCGKSVLAKYLVDDVLPTTGRQSTCYFFFKDDFEDQRTLVGALRCLLHQAFEHNPSLLDDKLFSKRFEGNRQILDSRADLWEIFTDNVIRSQVVEGFICILDAFDECPADDRSFLMKSLQKLYMGKDAPPIKLLLTSRPYEDIARGLRKLQNKELIIHLKGESEQEMDKISQEIDLVIEKNVDDLGEDLDLEPDVTDLIKDELTKVENRTYLWVALMIDILKNAIQTSKIALKSLIQRLPRSVSAAYEKILSREQNDETNIKTRRLLHIIMAAKEPLSPGQIAVAFSISDGTLFDEKAISRDTKFIRDFSRLLVVIRSDKIYLAHQTVREFLVMDSIKPSENALLGPFVQWEHSFHHQHSNRVLAGSCMSYLERCDSDDRIFLDYAEANWYDHLRESGDADEMMVQQSRNLCNPSSKAFQSWFKKYWDTTRVFFLDRPRPPPPINFTGLIVASMLGLKDTVGLLLTTQQNLHAKDFGIYKTAFSWACFGAHFSVVELLLNWVYESNTNSIRAIINTSDYRRNTPLHDILLDIRRRGSDQNKEAAEKKILRLLLTSGANPNLQNDAGLAPLHIAAGCGKHVVKLLLRSGADPGLKNEDGFTAFHQAVKEDNWEGVQMLLKRGAESNINSRDSHYSTPLLHAIENGALDIAKLLLDRKADVNLTREVYSVRGRLIRRVTPLTHAIECEQTEISEFLLKKGAHIDVASQAWKRLLVDAVRNGNREIITILLDRRCHLNFVLDDTTPLLAALECTDRRMIEFLLNHGADVEYPAPEEEPSVSSEVLRRMQSYRAHGSIEDPISI